MSCGDDYRESMISVARTCDSSLIRSKWPNETVYKVLG